MVLGPCSVRFDTGHATKEIITFPTSSRLVRLVPSSMVRKKTFCAHSPDIHPFTLLSLCLLA